MRDGTPGICNPLQWNFFGGKLEENENPLPAAQRELKEEVGISSSTDDFFLLGEMNHDDGMVYFFKYTPQVNWRDLDIREGAGAGFFTKKEISNLDITEQAKLLAERFL